MDKTYRIFKAYCLTVIAVLCVLLFAVGIYTAKLQTDETVFKSTYSTVRVLTGENNVTVNLGGRILNFVPDTASAIFEKARIVLLAPINNIIELIKQAVGLL